MRARCVAGILGAMAWLCAVPGAEAREELLIAGGLAAMVAGTEALDDRLIRKLSRHISQRRVHRFIGGMRGKIGESLRHRFNRVYFQRFMKERLGHFMIPVDPGPHPPRELIMKTFVLNEADIPKKVNPDFYFSSGYGQLLWWIQTAERHGLNLRTMTAVLELGTGTGRLIRHLRCIDGIRLVGTDLDIENVTWCRSSLPGIEFHQNALDPPLTFAEEGTFDFAFAASVFTHIPLETQGLWISEMRRVLKPGGFLLCDVLGRYHQEHMLDADDLRSLRERGSLTLTPADEKASLSTKVIGSWDVFMKRKAFLEAFGREFVVKDFLPGVIDLLVLQKPKA